MRGGFAAFFAGKLILPEEKRRPCAICGRSVYRKCRQIAAGWQKAAPERSTVSPKVKLPAIPGKGLRRGAWESELPSTRAAACPGKVSGIWLRTFRSHRQSPAPEGFRIRLRTFCPHVLLPAPESPLYILL